MSDQNAVPSAAPDPQDASPVGPTEDETQAAEAQVAEAAAAEALPADALLAEPSALPPENEAAGSDVTVSAPVEDATSTASDTQPAASADSDEHDDPDEVAAGVSDVEEPAAPATVRRSVSDEIARQLEASGIRICFTVPGESFLPLLDAMARAGIRIVTTRHESGAAFMAEALAQATGRPQVVAVSRAVGASNAAIGIHTASQDSAPLLVLVGQVPRPFLGREAFQEADLVHGIGSLASWAAQVDDPAELPTIMARAWRRLASGRPGPVLLSLPQDVQTAQLELPDSPPHRPAAARGPAADRTSVSQVLKMLAASERGVIVAGGGVLRARASKRLVALSEALAVPVIAAWRRPDVFPNDHPNYLGMAGVWAAASVRQRLADADVIAFIGARLSEVNTYRYTLPAPGTRWLQIDVQPLTEHRGLPEPVISIEADASRFLDAAWSDLRAAAMDNEMRSRREARTMADREAFRAASRVGQGTWHGPGVHPGRVVEVLRSVLPDNATICTDAGNMAGWLARGYRFRRSGTFLGPTSGAMGYGLPAAIAASLQEPDRIAVAVCGDGGFAMTMMELETAVREGAHPVVLVFDNERYGTIAQSQASEGFSSSASDLGRMDIAALARAQGALGFSVAEDDAFEPALREAIASRQTSVLHLSLDRSWRSVDDSPVADAG